MSKQSLQSQIARASLAECLTGAREALDGFPVAALLDHYLATIDRGPRSIARASSLVCQTMASWVACLSADIEAFPAGQTDTLAKLKRRLINSRDALVDLLEQLSKLEHVRAQAHQRAEVLPAVLHPAGSRLRGAFWQKSIQLGKHERGVARRKPGLVADTATASLSDRVPQLGTMREPGLPV